MINNLFRGVLPQVNSSANVRGVFTFLIIHLGDQCSWFAKKGIKYISLHPKDNIALKATLFVMANLIGFSSIYAQTVQVVLGTNNIPITEFKYIYNGSTVTKTSGGGSTVSTTLAVDIVSVKVTDGTSKTLDFFNFDGAYLANNNFTASVTGVNVIDLGAMTSAANTAAFEAKMNDVVDDPNILCALLYDNITNVPSGDDFDIRFARGLTNNDYVVVGERNGNTHFLVTPLDSVGNVISSASPLHFGNTTGTTSSNGNNRYDWNTTFAPNYTQPMYISVVDVSLFGTSASVYGFRIDNNGEADVKFFGMSDSTFDDNPVNLVVPGIIGNIFNDANGLTDATVNGSSVDTPSGTQLYVSLVQSGVVIDTEPVNSKGEYFFLNIPAGTYSTVLHTTSTGSTTSSLPTNCISTGENDGAGSGNDGTVNGISGSVVVTDSLETQINFAIEQLPDSDDKSYTLGTSPVLNEVRDLVSGDGMGSLTGSDHEDGTYGSGDDFIITDTTGLNGNILFYDIDGDGILDAGEELYPNDTVTNYDPTKLSVRFAGLNTTSFTFDYSWIDSAGMSDPTPATYTANWASPVPVQLVHFKAKALGDDAELTWITASEIDNKGFEIYRSTNNGLSFKMIDWVVGNKNSSKLIEYLYTDNNAQEDRNSSALYQLKQVDYSNNFEWSDVVRVSWTKNVPVIVYPNPASDFVTIDLVELNESASIEIRSLQGKLMESAIIDEDGASSINVSSLMNGFYFINITINGKVSTRKFLVNH